jgi:hypothetical protein
MLILFILQRKANVVKKWPPEHDLELEKEMLAERPFDYPKRSLEISAAWKKIMSNSKAKINFTLKTILSLSTETFNIAVLKLPNSFFNDDMLTNRRCRTQASALHFRVGIAMLSCTKN